MDIFRSLRVFFRPLAKRVALEVKRSRPAGGVVSPSEKKRGKELFNEL